MAPNFTPFTGFSYATGLASLGQGLGRIHDAMQAEQERQLLEEWGKNPTMQNAARTRNPAAIAASLKVDEQRRTDARTAQATQAGLSALGLGGGLGGLGGFGGGAPTSSAGAPSTPSGSRIGDISPDEDLAIRTVLGEASGEGPSGWRAVAGVIGNRAKGSGGSLRDVVLAPNQFEPWHSRRAELEGYDPNSSRYRAVASAILPILRGQEADPTGGATHFYSPGAQAGLGRRPPSWDDGSGTDIGRHRFFRLGYNGQGRHGIPQGDGGPATPVAQQPGGGAPTPQQVAGMNPDAPRPDAAAADAARVAQQGGPRTVLSPSSPLMRGGQSALSAQSIASAGTGAGAPYVPPGSVINTPAGASEEDITQAEIASGMRTPGGGFLPAGSLSSSDAPSRPGTPLPYRQPAQSGSVAALGASAPAAQPQQPVRPAAQARPRSPNAPNWQTADQVPQDVQASFARERSIDKLTVVMANPYTPEGLRQVAQMRLAALLNENDKLPESVKTYKWARANNQHGGLSYQEFTDRNAKSNDPGEKLKAETAAREAEATRLGLDPRSPEGQRYVLTGQLPAAERADRKSIGEADASIASAEETIGALRTAKSLSAKAYDGMLAGARGGITANFGSAAGTATMELDNVLQTTVLTGLKSIFGANPTEGERKIALEIAGSSNQPRQVREAIIDRAIQAAERRLGMARSKAEELRGGSYYKPGGGSARESRSAGPQASAASSAIPAGAVEMLRSDPSLAAQFDQKYGAGAARRVLGQ